MHPMGYEIKITTPLDWMGVTDHSEYVGVYSGQRMNLLIHSAKRPLRRILRCTIRRTFNVSILC